MIPLLNELGATATRTGMTLMIQSGALVVLLLVTEFMLARRMRPALRCALWLLIIARLLLPPALKSPTGIGYWLGPWLAEPVRLATAIPVAVPSEALPTEIPTASLEKPAARSAPPPRIHASGWLLLLWGAGALALGGWMIRRNREVYRLLRSAEPASPKLLDQLQESAQRIGLARLPELRLTPANHSPAVCGFLKPVVVLPSALARSLSPSALSDILLHELVHIRRRDLWFNLPQALAQVLWWWNPVVWLANARIRTLREQAVDEQVMLSRRGDPTGYPAALLEVARHCATRPALTLGFVGILESRSGLRSRVERLLQVPLPRHAGLGATGWLVVILAALMALPMAFARRVEVEAPPAAPPGNPRLVVPGADGPFLLDGAPVGASELESKLRELVPGSSDATLTVRMDVVEAEHQLNTIAAAARNAGFRRLQIGPLRVETANQGVSSNISGYIEFPLLPVEPPQASNPDSSRFRSGQDQKTTPQYIGEGQKRIQAKLDSMVLPEVQFDDVPLGGVVKFLDEQARALDPGGNGLNFIINSADPSAAPSIDPATGIAMNPANAPANLEQVRIRIGSPVSNVRLSDLLSLIVESAEHPLRYAVEDYAVVFSQQLPEAPQLYTRTFRVDTRTFLEGIRSSTDPLATTTHPPESNGPLGSQTEAARTQRTITEFFRSAGVNFLVPTNQIPRRLTGVVTTDQNQKALYFNDRSGMLFVRATLSDLDVIEKAIETLNVAPPQVLIEAKFIEVNPDAVEGLDLVFDQVEINTSAESAGGGGIGGGTEFSKPYLAGIMTEIQFRSVMERLEARPGTTILVAPKITTLSGRQAQVSLEGQMHSVPNPASGQTKQGLTGPKLNVIPSVRFDTGSIRLTVVASTTRLDGDSNSSPPTAPPPTAQWVAGEVPDGHTLVLTCDVPAEPTAPDAKRGRLLVFVTATVIDPAGNRVNSPNGASPTGK